MAYSISFHGAPDQEGAIETFFLCSVGAWNQFGAWTEPLWEEFDAIEEFFVHGECRGTERLAEQLVSAAESRLPPPPVQNTISVLLDEIGEGDEDEIISLTDDQETDAVTEFATRAAKRSKGEVWQGPSGRWFTINAKGRAAPAKAPGAATKEKAVVSAKAELKPAAKPVTKPAPVAPATPVEPKDPETLSRDPAIMSAAKDAYDRLHSETERFGGIVKVPELTDLVQKAVPGITPAEMHGVLQEWQRQDKLTLQLCNDPHLEKRADEGIKTSKGLLMYIQMRPGDPLDKPAPAPAKAPAPAPAAVPAKKEASVKAPSSLHAAITKKLAGVDEKTLAKIAKLLGVATPKPAKVKPSAKPKTPPKPRKGKAKS